MSVQVTRAKPVLRPIFMVSGDLGDFFLLVNRATNGVLLALSVESEEEQVECSDTAETH